MDSGGTPTLLWRFIMYPWPIGDFDYAIDVALDTAMNHLERAGQAEKFVAVQRVAATAIATAWKMGERRRLRLADIAITAVERKTQPSSQDQKLG